MKRLQKSRPKQDKSESDLALFGPPNLLQGESSEHYDEILARIRAAAKPLDVIEEMFVQDVMRLQWEILRWQRFKTSLIIRATGEALKVFLSEKIGFELYRAKFEHDLTKALAIGFPDDQDSKLAAALARRCADDEAEAIAKAQGILSSAELDYDTLVEDVEEEKVAELVENCAMRDPKAMQQVKDVLAEHGLTLDDLTARALGETSNYTSSLNYLGVIERFDHLLTVAENRRNASLPEIDRYRAAFGQAVRRSLDDVENAEFKVIEGPSPPRKSAA